MQLGEASDAFAVPAVCSLLKEKIVEMKILNKQLAIFLMLAASVAYGQPKGHATYSVSDLTSVGGTISRGNSINNDGSVSGYSFTALNSRRHAALWLNGGEPTDLGTLAGPDGYSSVVWPVKNNNGIIAGISQTSIPDPNHENWSCSPFLYGVFENITGNTCVGVVWQNGIMRALPTLGGYNGFAAGANNRGQVTGWTETTYHDPSCNPESGQVLQFLPVIWGPGTDQITQLPLIPGDSSGSATNINDRGQAIGISGTCDQAVGRYSAAHAVLWENGIATEIVGNNGGPYWDTPMAINDRGDVVGFVGTDNDIDGNKLRAFIWTRKAGFRYLQPLPLAGHIYSEARGINNKGQIVGVSCLEAAVACKPVIWENGSSVAVNLDLLAPDYSGVLTAAQDINDDGQITGRANSSTGERVTFVATPVD
jgi:probable HAF family extracellular repeat protein